MIAAPSGAQIPISEVAKISFSRGPAMVRDEDGQLTGYVYINLNPTDYGDFVDQANDAGPKSVSRRSPGSPFRGRTGKVHLHSG